MKKLAVIIVLGSLLAAAFTFLLIILRDRVMTPQAPDDKPAEISYPLIKEVLFDSLPGWQQDDHAGVLSSFALSCETMLKQPAEKTIQTELLTLKAKDWFDACNALTNLSPSAAKAFFEQYFVPHAVIKEDGSEGLFTGYFAPIYDGSLEQNDEYAIPLYRRPDHLIRLDLGQFDENLKNKSILGQVKGDQFIPFDDRDTIEQGSLEDKGLEFIWLKNMADAFFLHIQGSGMVRLPDGEQVLVGFAAKNGRPYKSVGRVLLDEGHMLPGEMSMQGIRKWMGENPEKAREIIWHNPSFIFFRRLDGLDGPVGSQGVVLTPERSMAVDPQYVPMGMPLWLDIDPILPDQKLIQRLVIAQDTGSAIKGTIRGDFYWGIGDQAGANAGRMKNPGTYYLLIPKKADLQVKAP